MNTIKLQAIPNQKISIILEQSLYDITVRETNGVMSATIVRDGNIIVEGERIVAGTLILPYLYQEVGNFIFLNLNGELIYYTNFGASQNLVYLTENDLINLRSQNGSGI